MPQDDVVDGNTTLFYEKLDLEGLKDLTGKAFEFYLTDPYMSKFWRIAHMEQYTNPQIYEMFRKIFMENAVSYQEQLFGEMMKCGIFVQGDAKAAAINFYAPIYLLLSMYSDRTERKEEALAILDRQIEEFYRIYRKKD